MGVSRFLGYLVGGTKVPRKFGMGVSKILGYLVGVPEFLTHKGVHNIPGYMERGCQISWDAKYAVTERGVCIQRVVLATGFGCIQSDSRFGFIAWQHFTGGTHTYSRPHVICGYP